MLKLSLLGLYGSVGGHCSACNEVFGPPIGIQRQVFRPDGGLQRRTTPTTNQRGARPEEVDGEDDDEVRFICEKRGSGAVGRRLSATVHRVPTPFLLRRPTSPPHPPAAPAPTPAGPPPPAVPYGGPVPPPPAAGAAGAATADLLSQRRKLVVGSILFDGDRSIQFSALGQTEFTVTGEPGGRRIECKIIDGQ